MSRITKCTCRRIEISCGGIKYIPINREPQRDLNLGGFLWGKYNNIKTNLPYFNYDTRFQGSAYILFLTGKTEALTFRNHVGVWFMVETKEEYPMILGF